MIVGLWVISYLLVGLAIALFAGKMIHAGQRLERGRLVKAGQIRGTEFSDRAADHGVIKATHRRIAIKDVDN